MKYLIATLALVACNGPDDSDVAPVDTDSDSPPSFCELEGQPEVPWNDDGPYGVLRHDLADNFFVDLVDGSTWSLQEHWTGCESYIFVPDTIPNSYEDPTSVWERDLDELVEASPPYVHY